MDIKGLKKMDKYTVQLPLLTADSRSRRRSRATPSGSCPSATRPIPAPQIGTGAYKLKSFTPGQQSVSERNPNYWRSGQPYFDTVTIIDFPSATAQVNALLGGQIDAMTDLPAAQVQSVKSHQMNALISKMDPGSFRTRRALLVMMDAVGFRGTAAEEVHQRVVQLRSINRLQQERIDADLFRLCSEIFPSERRDHNDARSVLQPGLPLDDRAGLQTVHIRHLPVHQDELVRIVMSAASSSRMASSPEEAASARSPNARRASPRISRAWALSSTTRPGSGEVRDEASRAPRPNRLRTMP